MIEVFLSLPQTTISYYCKNYFSSFFFGFISLIFFHASLTRCPKVFISSPPQHQYYLFFFFFSYTFLIENISLPSDSKQILSPALKLYLSNTSCGIHIEPLRLILINILLSTTPHIIIYKK